MKPELADTQERLSQFVHDLRNPLNTISVNAELIRMQVQFGKSPEQLLEAIERILSECKKADELLKTLTVET